MVNHSTPKMASIQLLTNSVANNFSMKLPGLVPTACYGNMTLLNYQNSGRTTINYPINNSPKSANWIYRNGKSLISNRIVTQLPIINGQPNMM